MGAAIWEKRFGEHSEDDFRVGSSVGLTFEFDASDRVSKIEWIRQEH